MNFIDGRVRADDGRFSFVADGVHVTAADGTDSGRRQFRGDDARRIRPEDLTMVSAEASPTDALGSRLSGRVLLVERLGGTSHVHCEVGPHRVLASVSTEHLPEVGDLIELQVPFARVHLFGADGRSVA